MRNLMRSKFWLAVLYGVLSTPVVAEDIDIYTTGQVGGDAPNVLFFIDNTSNWIASNQKWEKGAVKAQCAGDAECLRYVNIVFGAATADGTTLEQGQVQLRALRAVLKELICDVDAEDRDFNINIGLMLFANSNGTADGNNVTPGYIRRAIKSPDDFCASTNSLLADLETIDLKINDPEFKTSASADYGTALYEAFKYFGGHAATSGTEADVGGTPVDATHFGPAPYGDVIGNTFADPSAFTNASRLAYKSPIGDNLCGQNYLVLIGNGWPNQEFGTNQNASPPTNQLMTRLGLQPQQLYSVANRADIRFADEWAQFLSRTDVSSIAGQQPVKTYTIDVYNTTVGGNREKQAALLSSMASNGGTGVSGSFTVGGDLGALVDAFKRIFTQIASVSSSFASAALPISANTQGTYLNQVFVGMFRPIESALPRWSGNLKQYQFALQTITDPDSGISRRELFLADASGKPAVDNVVTGFIDDCALSFWTHDSSNYWQSIPTAQGSRCPTTTYNIFSDRPDGPIVERGGVAQMIRDLTAASGRTIRTCAAAPANCTGNAALSINESDNLDLWIRGANVGDGDGAETVSYTSYGKSTSAIRPSIHGGVVHSRPLALNYGGSNGNVVVFYGADDGMLRAIDGNQTSPSGGTELWAFLAPEFKSKMTRLRDNKPTIKFATNPAGNPKDYFFDGSIGAYVGPDPDNATLTVTYIYPSMRRGGRMVYAFNATTKPSFANPPSAMWRFGCDHTGQCYGGADTASLGQTWSTPRVIRVKIPEADGSHSVDLHVVFGGGYDSCEDAEPRNCTSTSKGNGIFVLNAKSGAQQRYISLGNDAGRVLADIVPVDVNNDGFTDLLYAVDTSGNLWRLNIDGLTPASWALTQVAKVGDWSSENERNRKFLYAPSVVRLGNYNLVLVGTGDREKPLNDSHAATVKNRFYGFWDNFAVTATDVGYVMVDDSGDCDEPGDIDLETGCQVMNTSDTSQDYNVAFATAANRPAGWTIDLDEFTENGPNEQVVTQPAVIGGQVFFSTFQPTKPGENVCSARGTARGYAACFLHGGATCNVPVGTLNRSIVFTGGGMPPSPVVGLVSVDNQTVPFCIGCADPEGPPKSAQEGTEVKIPIVRNRSKIYRYKRID